MGVIFPIVFYILNTTSLPSVHLSFPAADSEKVIYLVKIRWHTGIVFRTDQVDTSLWNIADFRDFRYVDAGWGDADFYQHPGFDIDLAVKALFMRTESTLRLAGIARSIEDYLRYTDYAERIVLNENQFKSLCFYISSTYLMVQNRPVILSEHSGESVIFYKARGYYTLFNTCNTWIARGLAEAGLNIDDDIILAEQLFKEAADYGVLVKTPE